MRWTNTGPGAGATNSVVRRGVTKVNEPAEDESRDLDYR